MSSVTLEWALVYSQVGKRFPSKLQVFQLVQLIFNSASVIGRLLFFEIVGHFRARVEVAAFHIERLRLSGTVQDALVAANFDGHRIQRRDYFQT